MIALLVDQTTLSLLRTVPVLFGSSIFTFHAAFDPVKDSAHRDALVETRA